MNTNVVYLDKIRLETQIDVSAANSVANDPAAAVYEAVVAMKQKIDTLDAFVKEGVEVLKGYMGDKETLISADGRRLATWNWVKGAVTIDRKALEIHFADVYEIVKRQGDPTRRFELK